MISLIAVTGGFAGGVLLRSLFIFGWQPVVFALLLAALLGSAAFLKPRLAYSLGAVFFFCVALGMLRTSIADTPLPQSFTSELHHKVTYTGTVTADPDVRDTQTRFVIAVHKGEQTANILVSSTRPPLLMVGDSVSVSGVLLLPQPFEEDTGRVFPYDKFLERQGILFSISFAQVRMLGHAAWYSLPVLLASIKHTFLHSLDAVLPHAASALAGGILVGGKTSLGKALQDAFTRSGLIQIVVLSGYNVMIVAEWVLALLSLMPLPRTLRAVGAGGAVVLFVGIAGFSATAVRALIMALIALYARATGKTYNAGRALIVTIFLMLLVNPLTLLYDPGFGLSVAATAGLIWWSPRIEAKLARIRSAFLRSTLATTLAAQIAVLPLLLYQTGLLSLVSLPANLLTTPVVPFAMALALIAGLAGLFIAPFSVTVAQVIAWPAKLALGYLIWIAEKAATLTFAAFSLPPFSFWLVVLAYAALIFAASSKRFSITSQFTFAKKAST